MRYFMLLIASLMASGGASAQSFRGLPYFVKVESLTLTPHPTDPALNQAQVCYRFATTIPILDYTDFASKTLKGVKVKRKDTEGGTVNGDTQSQGIEFQFTVSGFNFYAYLNSSYQGYGLQQLSFFNSAVRTTAGMDKPLLNQSFGLDYQSMLDPQYEWVQNCELIPFGKAFSERYVRGLFQGPGPIGALSGDSRFEFNIFVPIILGSKPAKVSFNGSSYVTPIFGLPALENDDYRMIALAHYINSFNAVQNNLDEQTLNEYLEQHQDILQAFEERYGIHVELPIDTEKLLNLIRQVAGLKNKETT